MIKWDYIEAKRQRYYSKYQRKILTALRKTIMPVVKETRIRTDGFINSDILITDEYIKEVYIDLYKKVGFEFIKDLVRELRKDFERDVWDMEMEKYIEYIAAEKIALVTNYTKDSIRIALQKAMKEGLEEGISFGDIMKRIRTDITKGDYATFTKARALRIARTEVMTASNQGGFIAAGMSGAFEKVWMTAPSGVAKTERHNRIGMNGQKRPMDQPFDVDGQPMMYPGDSSLGAGAENIINCNCTMAYI